MAAKHGYSEAISLLIEAGARHDVGSKPPIISALESGSRAALTSLVKSKPREILSVYNEKPLLVHALEMKSTLLPVVATLVREETLKMKEEGDPNAPPFPPTGLTSSQQKRLNTALERQDSVMISSFTPENDIKIRHVWAKISEQKEETTIATEFREQKSFESEPFGVPEQNNQPNDDVLTDEEEDNGDPVEEESQKSHDSLYIQEKPQPVAA
ncbi:hypothetical protein TVAG_466710 [Trichomonas vaginalis G3]|uniref:Ankyrin repeat protein n=1 Tax=Trichomonas vaginalis (strain ATCC PRA-98 / G3) TaxID=412133 RepID=A2FL97_TRIV3|nr:spectrin binding [Trichomonas vaginalis G3]EAX94313.1 hypothetical protein TVAG_466710 [Trichomonas vaginalis G3]KAI5533515.1 spectrin binding [Trichomonas vaginalis G3]|eukprot:XP_001307243.1 hypothetical protein [Trichomonas vaginalis G3]